MYTYSICTSISLFLKRELVQYFIQLWIYLSAAQTRKHPIITSAARSSVSPAFPCPDFDKISSA